MWIAVRKRFKMLADNLKLTDTQIADGVTKHRGITAVLNAAYYDTVSDSNNRILAGSWAKFTRMRPPRDIDMLFVLPVDVYNRFQGRQRNKQSQLLQEVKAKLSAAYDRSDIRGDGPVVFVDFATYKVEVVPAFLLENGKYLICDTSGGGRYNVTDPVADIANMTYENEESSGNVRHLIKMMKCWQSCCSVPLKSFCIELLAIDFMRQYTYKNKDFFYHDFMSRDFFVYIMARAKTSVDVPGTGEAIPLGDAWLSRAESAFKRAAKACEYEWDDSVSDAGDEWQKIFGQFIPKCV